MLYEARRLRDCDSSFESVPMTVDRFSAGAKLSCKHPPRLGGRASLSHEARVNGPIQPYVALLKGPTKVFIAF